MANNLLLHQENLASVPLLGGPMVNSLNERAGEALDAGLTTPVPDSYGVTVLIRTRNDAEALKGIFADLSANQTTFSHALEVIVVDTESTDGTQDVARAHGATVCNIAQRQFNYPRALNRGMDAASYNDVFSIVGHSALSNIATLLAIRRHANNADLGGAYGLTLPNANASRTELWLALIGQPLGTVTRPPVEITEVGMGVMGANAALFRRDVWADVGGFDERYGAGGEDGQFARQALAAGAVLVRDPVLCMYHTHGLGPIDTIRQFRNWARLAKPLPFRAEDLQRFRSDLDLPERS